MKGFVLPIVLLFLMIFAILAVSTLTIVQIEQHISSNLASHIRELQIVEAGLESLEKNLFINENSQDVTANILAKPWLSSTSYSLSLQNQSLHYVIEQLPNLANICIRDPNLPLHRALFYRITIWSLYDSCPSIILQSIMAARSQELCKDMSRQISAQRLSWREVA